jgi:anti-anti-sigma factor
MTDSKYVSIESRNEVLLVTALCTEMDEERTRALQDEASTAAATAPSQPVVLDLSRVTFVPSLSLAALVTLQRTCKTRGQRLVLAGVQQNVRGALTVTHLDRLFQIFDTPEDAISHLRGESL